MFRRKRRMELARPGERRRREERERDVEPISRRVFVFRGAMGLAFAGLSAKLWSMQIGITPGAASLVRELKRRFSLHALTSRAILDEVSIDKTSSPACSPRKTQPSSRTRSRTSPT